MKMFERAIKTAARIYCTKCWTGMSESANGRFIFWDKYPEDEEKQSKEKIKAAMKLMEKQLNEYNNEMQYSFFKDTELGHYDEHFNLARGKVDGMKEALRILKGVMG